MKPRELLIDRLNSEVVPALKDEGFKFAKSSLQFSRKVHGVKQFFFFSLNRWTREPDCEFHTHWRTALTTYNRWHLSRYGEKSRFGNEIDGSGGWNIPGWPRFLSNEFHLNGSSKDDQELAELIDAIKTIGIPYLIEKSDIKAVADSFVLSDRHSFSRASDYYLLSGENELARKAVKLGLSKIRKETDEELISLNIRKELFAQS